MEITKRSLRSLDWDKLKYYLSSHCETPSGKSESLEIDLQDVLSIVRELLGETQEAHFLLTAKFLPSLHKCPEMRSILERLASGAPLNVKELFDLREVLITSNSVKTSLSSLDEENFAHLSKWVKQLRSVERVVGAIDFAIDEQGNLRDEASSELRSLRASESQIKSSIKEQLSRLIHSSELSKALQEPLYTQRNGRYVLPVIASMRISYPGIIHDSSASGLTVYIEPSSIIPLSNNLKVKQVEIEHEIERILNVLSGLARERYDEIAQTYRVIIELDKIFARARLGITYDGTIPLLTEEQRLQLYDARHPLLILQNASHNVIGNDIVLGASNNSQGEEGQALIITGPNTGGKTVLLKTIGLLSVMVRAGLMLPVKAGSTLCIFKEIFSDIGDEQSLEQNLSTFSAHLVNVQQLISQSGNRSLILLDEIGAGTDPKEGAALAQAILEHLQMLGAITVVTTHLSELKSMGYSGSNFINASFAFDAENLVPTYKLRLGIPGSSQAVTIAKCLGLKQSIVERTNELLTDSKDKLQQTIDDFEERLSELQLSREEAKADEKKASELRLLYETKLEQLTNESEILQQEYAAQIAIELEQSKKLIKELTADLQKQPNLAKVQSAQLKWQTIKDELKQFNKPVPKAGDSIPPQLLEKGQKVFVASIGQIAVVEEIPKDLEKQSDPIIQLRSGSIRIRLPLSEIRASDKNTSGTEKLGRNTTTATTKRAINRAVNQRSQTEFIQAPTRLNIFVRTASNTLDLRGQRVEHALSLLAAFVDTCVHHSISPSMIIHGHGTGALKSAVREELSKDNLEFQPGDNYEGGDGVTLVFLK